MSKVPIKPLGDRIVATRQETASKTVGGLYLPTGATQKSQILTVVAIGENVRNVKNGDQIIVDEAGYGFVSHVKIDGVEYVIVKVENILGVIQ